MIKKNNKWLTNFLWLFLLIAIVSCSTPKQEYKKKFYDLVLDDYRDWVTLDTNYIKELAIDYVIEGSKLQQTNRYAESILEFQEALKYDSSASIQYAIAKNYNILGKYETSIDVLKSALKKEPDFIPAMALLVSFIFAYISTSNSITILEHIINLEPKRIRKIYLGQLYESVDMAKAIAIYEELLKEKIEPEILVRIATLYERMGDNAKMLESYARLLEYSLTQPIDYDRMLNAFLEHKDYSNAMRLLDSARSKFSDDEVSYFYYNMGEALINDTSTISFEISKKIVTLIEKDYYFDWKMNTIGGYLALKMGDSLTTIKLHDRALQTDTSANTPLMISFFYLNRNNYEKSLEILNEYNKKFPNNLSFPLYRSNVYQSMGKYDEALFELLRAQKIEENNIEILSQIGLIYDRLGKYDSCEIAYRKVLAIEPENALINNNFAYSMAERGVNLDTALLMSQKSLFLEPDNPSYLDTYGWINYKLGNYELALEYIKKAISAGEENAEVLEHLGYIYLKLNMKKEAIETWKKSLIFEPNEELEQQIKLLLQTD